MLRPYQKELAQKAKNILISHRICYLAAEMRVGKTLIALESSRLIQAKSVLFLTKKKAIQSIKDDYNREKFEFNLTVVNYEQAWKLNPVYDVVIVDEAHSLGAFPRPSLRTKIIKGLVGRAYLILLSGTPSPESYSQLYHQFWISDFSPFEEPNFYKWAKNYVNIKEVIYSGVKHNDYTNANKELIMSKLNKYFLTYTREKAGFEHTDVNEKIIDIQIDDRIYILVQRLVKDFYYKMKDGREIVCDTAVKLQSKVHQIFSGTVKTEDGNGIILDYTKAEFIKNNYKDKKIAIYYKFIAEGEALRQVLGKSNVTESPEEFRETDKIFISQIQSGSMGIDLSVADVLIFYNIDFSAVQYWQARARLQALERVKPPEVHWLFAKNGIEYKIYQAVQKKKDYTNYYFRKDYLNGERKFNTVKDYKVAERARLLHNKDNYIGTVWSA